MSGSLTDRTTSALSSMRTFANLSTADCEVMDRIGAVWNDDINSHRRTVMEIYSPLAARAPKVDVDVRRNVPYGAHARQVLDIYSPHGAAQRPVVVFVHGGAFVRGQKDMNEDIYSNVLWYFARHGIIGVNVEYRHAPEAQYPAGAADVGAAVSWIAGNIATHGGDPSRIVLVGHSAGGTHVAGYMFDPGVGVTPDGGVKGLVLISGRLRADTRSENPNAVNVAAYFGSDQTAFEARSPVSHVARCAVPVFVAIAEHENRLLDVYGAEFYWRLAAVRGRASRFLRLLRHNHTSIVAHINTGEDVLGAAMREFMATECGMAVGA